MALGGLLRDYVLQQLTWHGLRVSISYRQCEGRKSEMDPVSILGAAASAASVVQMCTDSVTSLLRFQTKYKNADLTVRLLITQVSTLRTALSQISEWVEVSVDNCLPHVISDLTMSLDGCRLLIETLNDHLSRLEYNTDKAFTMRKKAQTIWGERERTDFLSLLSHNIAALQLLLTAMQWYDHI